MLWQWSPSVIAELVASAILLVLAIYFPWRDLNRQARLTAVTLIFVCALWILSHAFEIGLPVVSYKESLMGVQLVLGIIAATFALFYIFHYFGPRKLLARRIYILFGIIPLIAILAISTNNIYGLMWTASGIDSQNPYLPLEPTYGIIYWVCMVYAAVLTFTGSYLIIWSIIRRRYSYSRESIYLLVAAVIPLITAFVEVMGLLSFLKISVGLTSWAACIGAIILILNLPKFRSEQVIPIARDIIFERIGDCILVLDMQNRVLDLNPAAEQLIGYRISDVFGMSTEQIWPYQSTPMMPFNKMAKAGEELVLERDGKQRAYDMHISTITDSDGRLTNQVVSLTDITERKQVESALQESEQSYRRLAAYHKQLNDISIAFAEASNTEDLFDRIAESFRLLTGAIAATFTLYNQETGDLKVVSLSIDPVSRHKVDVILGPGLFEMRMPISADVMEQMLSQGIRRRKDLHELSFGVIPRDISDAAMEATGCKQIVALAISYAEELIGTCVAYLPGDQPVASDDALKTYAHIVGLAVKRKQVEEKLKANEEKYRLLSEHTTDAVWLMDMNLKPTYQSPSEEKLRGYTPQEVLDLPLEKQITPESLKLALEVFSEEIPKVEADPGYNPVLTFDFEYYRKDGTTMWAESKFSLIRDENGKPVSILGEGRDITERKQVEEALRESETQYRMLAEHTADTVWLMNRDFKITYVSPTVQKLRGFTPQEILEMAVEKQLTPDSLKLAYELFFQELPKVDADSSYNPIYTLELEFSRKDGSTVWAESKFSIIRDGSGKAVSLLGEARDITERRQMEEALKDSEAKYRLLADNTVDGVWLLDLNLKLMYCSPASEKQSGFTLQEIMEMSMDQYFTPESLKLASALFLEELPRVEADPGYNPIITLELEFYKKDGTAFWAECKFSIIRDKYGKPVSILGQARDITERRRIESVLKESEEKYRMLVENALEAILIAIDGMLKFANYRATELTGYSQEELISRPFIEFIYPDDHQMVAERHIQRLKGMDVPKTYAFRIVCKQGDIKWVELAAALITWEGRPATLSFLTDITDRRRLEEERQRVERLESVGLLAGGIAHDFNNIMTAILGNISIAMVEAGPGSEIQESLEQAEKALLRAKELTRQLLTFSKGGTPVKKLASLTELLRDTVGFALRGSNIKCHFSIPADLWHAEIDAGQVSQVIHNLVINAQQAMPNGGFIELKAENMVLREKQRLGRGMPLMEGNYIRIAVTDHGSGIPADNLARVFDPFFTTKHKGSGLGLATAFSIAHNHNGHLSVVSALGSGSTFYFYLPASMETSAQKQDSKEEIKPAGKARILVMDDEEVVRNVAGRLLKHIGYEDIKFAADGGEALKLYKEAMETGHPFKVVILDLTIPGGMGGDIAVKKLLKIDPGVRAIVSSGYAAEAIMADYKKYGFSGMVAKPYTLEELSKAVQDVIG